MLVLGVFVAWREYRLANPGALEVHVLDVGQGDSIFMVSPTGKQVLIDGGPNLATLRGLGKYMPFFDRSIDLLVLSHPDLDHIASFPEVLRRYQVKSVLMTGIDTSSSRYQEFLSLLPRENAQILLSDKTDTIDLGDGVKLSVLWPKESLYNVRPKSPNNTSILLRATFGSSSLLFTGDMELPEENAIVKAGIDLNADILKIAHHGSKTSTSTGFLLKVNPSLAIISVSATNTYGHPHPIVMNRLRHFGIPVRMTSQEGDINLTFTQSHIGN